MGANQSTEEFPQYLFEYNGPYRSFSPLLKSNRKNISLIGERLANAECSSNFDESCSLTRMNILSLSTLALSGNISQKPRSCSLDEGENLNLWALHRLQNSDKTASVKRKKSKQFDKSNITIPIGKFYKVRKKGVSHYDCNKKFDPKLKATASFHNKIDDTDVNAMNISYDNSSSKKFEENWGPYLYEDTLVSKSSLNSECIGSIYDQYILQDNKTQTINVGYTSNINEIHSLNDLDTLENSKDMELNCQNNPRNECGRRSEPAFYSQHSTGKIFLNLPGLDIRRHTLPNSPNKCPIYQGKNSLTPSYTTTSWDILPPEEEIEVMEDKPIGIKENEKKSDYHFTKKSLTSQAPVCSHPYYSQACSQNNILEAVTTLNNSNSSTNSFCPCYIESKKLSSNEVINRSPCIPKSSIRRNPYCLKNCKMNVHQKATLNEITVDQIQVPNRIACKMEGIFQEENPIFQNALIDTSNISYDTTTNDIIEWQIPNYCYAESNLIHKATEERVCPTITKSLQPYLRPQTYQTKIVSDNHGEEKEKNLEFSNILNPRNNYEYPPSQTIINSERDIFDQVDNTSYTNISVIANIPYKINNSAHVLPESAEYDPVWEDHYSNFKNSVLTAYDSGCYYESEEDKHHNKKIKVSFPDLQYFTQEVETRIPTSTEALFTNPTEKEANAQFFSNLSKSILDQMLYSSPTGAFQTQNQIMFSKSSVGRSSTTSVTCLSDYSDSSVEPYSSSLCFSADEEDFDRDEWPATEKSFSSTPPGTPLLSPEDTCSLSLSDSQDFFDQHLENKIGFANTLFTQISPGVNNNFEHSDSNLSVENIGLEMLFTQNLRKPSSNKKSKITNNCYTSYEVNHPGLNKQKHCKSRDISIEQNLSELKNENCKYKDSQRNEKYCTEKQINLIKSSSSDPQLSFLSNNTKCIKNYKEITDSFENSSSWLSLPENNSGAFCEDQILRKANSDPAVKISLLNFNLNSSSCGSSKSESQFNTIIRKWIKSPNEVSEIEAVEACKWLRAAGFPQYSQMYEDLLFPLDLCSVERDHTFLDADSIEALFRRLRVLNRCAKIRHDSRKKDNTDDSEDEEQDCALSRNWTFEKHSRRWSRVDANQFHLSSKGEIQPCGSNRLTDESEEYSSTDHFKRSGSEKLKDGAKAFLRRMESLKNKKKRRHREGIVISSPKVLDEALMQVKMAELGCINISREDGSEVGRRRPNIYHRSASEQSSSQMQMPYFMNESRQASVGEDSSSLASEQSQTSGPRFRSSRRKRFWKRGFSGDSVGVLSRNADDEASSVGRTSCAYSDSECSPPSWHHRLSDASGSSKLESLFQSSKTSDKRRPNLRHATSLTYGKDSHKLRQDFVYSLRTDIPKPANSLEFTSFPENRSAKEARHSIYDNVPIVICNDNYYDYHSEGADIDMGRHEGSGSSECTMESRDSPVPSNQDEETEDRYVRRGIIERWHSFNRKSSAIGMCQRTGTQISGFSVGQMNHLRKRALLRLTALMERYCPSNRSSWNWELPKFIRKIKAPDYKDRAVFGIPLQIINQRTGYPLPLGIQQALDYLKTNCMDQVGIFRKPGVRSRIQRLRELHETEDEVEYYNFGPCDIADLVKLYFRELPEVLLTNKMSEIFIAICQYLPSGVRLEALQCVMLMMPDENREVLMHLLSFLAEVAAKSSLNQMTESNLSVCMAPSLFHLSVGSTGSSPLRKKTSGSPEQKDLHDNKSAHQCLTLMIQEVNNLQCVPVEMLSNCRFSFLDLSQPVALEDLGSTTNLSFSYNQGECHWIAYMNACIDSLLKESRERARGWFHINHPDPLVEVCYRKIGDGHPLRLWKVATEVEAPPTELLNRVLRERHLWDETLLKWRVVNKLNKQAEIFQYMCGSMHPRPPVDYCVLRCWKSDLRKGLCVIVETSVEHPNAPSLLDSTRGIVLASRYMIQPCGSGKSRITNISRIDSRGRLPEWYNKSYAYFAANHIVKLRQSFQHFATGPESKV